MDENEFFNSLFKEENNFDYEYEKMLKKLKIARSGYEKSGKFGMPLIKKQDIDLDKIKLMGYTKIKNNDSENFDKTIHFFTYDWNFENVYEKPEIALEKLDKYYALLTPQFSMYNDMPIAVKIYNVFKSRWCGAFWQEHGMRVIPTLTWGNDPTYEFCFDGIEKGCVVAISNYGIEDPTGLFMQGYNKMLEVIEPSAIIVYGEPYKEMKGNIICFPPYNKDELIKKMGLEKFMEKYISGEIYPDI